MSLSSTESPEERMVFSASLLIELLISFFPAPHPSTAGARAWIRGPDMCGEYDLSGVWGFKCLEEKKKKAFVRFQVVTSSHTTASDR